MKTKVKICDVRTMEMAEYCYKVGVDFIGIHQIYAPISTEKKLLLKDIRNVTGNMKIILVTKEENLDDLVILISQFDWDYIQLHFSASAEYIDLLKKELKTRYNRVPGIIAVMQIDKFNLQEIMEVSKEVDYLLFDSSMRGGTGKLASLESHANISVLCDQIDYFVAGGLNSENVNDIINITKPFAVDVQSGVEYSSEKQRHQKSPIKIKNFVETVKCIY